MKKRILFISHDSSRTGAPIMLLHLLSWLKTHTNFDIDILIQHEVNLNHKFESIAPTYTLIKKHSKIVNRLLKSSVWFRKLYLHSPRIRRLRKKLILQKYELVYVNTLAVITALEWLNFENIKLITHVHELEDAIQRYIKVSNFKKIEKKTTAFIAASRAVEHNLINKHDISKDKIKVVHEFIDVKAVINTVMPELSLKKLQIPNNSFIVGGSGVLLSRKGYDLFVELAHKINILHPELPIYFIWVGGLKRSKEYRELVKQINQKNLSRKIKLITEVDNPFVFYQLFDVLAMVSREDPYPLVNLEVAALGKPILCFENSGGSHEFVESDAGFVVPYLDIDEMYNKIIELYNNQSLKEELGNKALEKVNSRHNIHIGSKMILDIINLHV